MPRSLASFAVADTAFVATLGPAVGVVRVPNVSAASGTVTDYVALNLGAYGGPSDLAYDDVRDVLYVRANGALLAFEGASTATALQPAARVVTCAFVDGANVRLALDPTADRLFLSKTDGTVAVLDGASTADGATAPSRTLGGAVHPVSRPSEVFYDPLADRLVALLTGEGSGYVSGYAVWEQASTVDGDVAPDRLVTDATLPIAYPTAGHLDPTR